MNASWGKGTVGLKPSSSTCGMPCGSGTSRPRWSQSPPKLALSSLLGDGVGARVVSFALGFALVLEVGCSRRVPVSPALLVGRYAVDFSKFDGSYPLVAVVLILLLVAQNWLINRRWGWLGAIVPSIYIGLLVYLAVLGRVETLTDFVFAALGLFGLVAWWASSREARRQQSEEDQRLVVNPWTAADSSVSFPPPGTGVRRHTQLRVG